MSAGGGGGGTPLKILLEAVGLDTVKSGIVSIVPDLQKVQAAADTAGKKMGDMGKSVSTAGQAGSGLQGVSQGIDKIDQAADKAAQSSNELVTSTDRAKSSVEKLGSTTTTAATNVDKLNAGQEGLVASGDRAAGAQDKVAKSTENVSKSAQTTSTAVEKVEGSEQKLAQTTDKTTGSLAKNEKAIKEMGDESQASGQKVDTLTKEQEEQGKASENSKNKQEGLKSSFMSSMGAVTSLTGGTISLWQSYDSLSDAQLKVDKAQTKLQQTQLKADVLQQKLNKLTEEGKTGSQEYATTQEKLDIAMKKITTSELDLGNAQEDLNVTTAQFYSNLLPQGMTMLGSMTTLMANSGGTMDKLKKSLSNLSLETVKTSKAFSMISLTNPFFIALTVGGAVVAAFAGNLFGFRDAINNVGVALGNALGPLKPFLIMIGDMGNALAGMFGGAGDAQKAYAEETDESMGAIGASLEGAEAKTIDYTNQTATVLRNSQGEFIGFKQQVDQQMKEAGNATAILPAATGAATKQSKLYMDEMILKARSTIATLQKDFGDVQNLAGLEITGLKSGQSRKDKAGTLGNNPSMGVNTERNGRPLGVNLADLGIEQVTDGYHKAIISGHQLMEQMQKLGLTVDEQRTVFNKLTGELGYVVEVTNQDLAGTKNLEKAKAELEAQIAKGVDENGNLIISSNLVAGAQEKEASAVDQIITASQAEIPVKKELSDAQKKVNDMVNAASKDYATYNGILNSGVAVQNVYASGTAKQAAAQEQAMVSLVENVAVTQEYTRQLATAKGAGLEIAEGALKQADAFNQAEASMYENVGTLNQLNDLQKMSRAHLVSYVDGMVKSEIALKNQQLATSELSGEIDALRDQYARGEAQATAYNKGATEQAHAFELAKVQVHEIKGRVSELRKEYASGEAQTLAYNTALEQQREATENEKTAIHGLRGTIRGMMEDLTSVGSKQRLFNKGMYEAEIAALEAKKELAAFDGTMTYLIGTLQKGTAQADALKKGQNEMKQSILDSYLATKTLEGGMSEYIVALDAGLPQAIAYKNAIDAGSMANLKMAETTATTVGEIEDLTKNITDSDRVLSQYQAGFATGYKSMTEWAVGVQNAGVAAQGSYSAFYDMTNLLGVELPEGFAGSIEESKKFVEVMAGMPEAVQGAFDKVESAAEGMIGGLADAFLLGDDELDAAFEKLGDDAGFKIESELQEALEPEIIASGLKGQLAKGMEILMMTDLKDVEGLEQGVSGMIGNIRQAIEDDPGLATMGEPLIIALEQFRANPTDMVLFAQIQEGIENLGATSTVGANMQREYNKTLTDAKGFVSLKSNIKDVDGSLKEYTGSLETAKFQFTDMNGAMVNAGDQVVKTAEGYVRVGEGIVTAGEGAAGAKEPTDMLGEAFVNSATKLGIFVNVLKLLPKGVEFTVGLMNTEFDEINILQPLVMTNFNKYAQVLDKVVLATGSTVKDTNVYFAAMNPQQTAFVSKWNNLKTSLPSLANMTKSVVDNANKAYAAMNPQQSAFVTKWNALKTTLPSLANMTNSVVTNANTAYAQMNPTQPAFVQKWNTLKSTLPSLANLTNSVAGNVNRAFGAMSQGAANMGNNVANSANRAANAVGGVVREINNLRGKTVYIDVVFRYKTTGRPPSGVGFSASSANQSAASLTGNTANAGFAEMIESNVMNSSISSVSNTSVSASTLRSSSIVNGGGGGGRSATYATGGTNNTANIINRFNESVQRITTMYDRQEAVMNSNIVNNNISSVSNVRRTSGSGGFAGTSIMGGAPNNITNITNGGNSFTSSSGGGGGSDVSAIVAMVRDIIRMALGSTNIALTNEVILDGDMIDRSIQKRMGLRNGAMLK